MKYNTIISGQFVSRPNRFIAQVQVDGAMQTVHVKNTGRCKELLLPGADVRLEVCDNPNRKTKYDLVAVYKPSLGWVNIDSQAPNKVVQEWLQTEGYDLVRPEYTYGGSRIDFYMEKGEEKYMLEVNGCTLEVDGIGYFPDAPTLRGVKHLHELAKAAQQGYHCAVAFVIQMEGVAEVRPNTATHPQFAEALAQARTAGVKVLFLLCRVEPDGWPSRRQGNGKTEILQAKAHFGGPLSFIAWAGKAAPAPRCRCWQAPACQHGPGRRCGRDTAPAPGGRCRGGRRRCRGTARPCAGLRA